MADSHGGVAPALTLTNKSQCIRWDGKQCQGGGDGLLMTGDVTYTALLEAVYQSPNSL